MSRRGTAAVDEDVFLGSDNEEVKLISDESSKNTSVTKSPQKQQVAWNAPAGNADPAATRGRLNQSNYIGGRRDPAFPQLQPNLNKDRTSIVQESQIAPSTPPNHHHTLPTSC
jgi:hypothetical protein